MNPGDLVRKIAEVFERTEMSVLPLDRAAAAAGLRASGARGVNAPRMRSNDAAALVLMVLAHTGGISPEATANHVKDIWKSSLYKNGTPNIRVDASRTPNFTSDKAAQKFGKSLVLIRHINNVLGAFSKVTNENGTFGACLSALVEDCVSGQMQKFLDDESLNLKISISESIASLNFTKTFNEEISLTAAYQFFKKPERRHNVDITTIRETTIIPLLRVSEAFRA